MKYIVIVPDGVADYPIESLGNRTPLEVANIPNINFLAKNGILGRVSTIPYGFNPGSDIAILSLLGYEPEKYYTGRGALEAANLGIKLESNDLIFRCNLITEKDGKILDYSGGHITDEEADVLIKYLDEKLGNSNIKFYHGKSYRNLMYYKNGFSLQLHKLKCFPPHDILGKEIQKYLPEGENSKIILEIMEKSKQILRSHPINKNRIQLGKNPANMIWLWGCGRKPEMELFESKFGLKGAVISAVDLIKGIGKIIGLKVIEVKGATGYYDTNYKGKGESAVNSLKELDFVFVHIEATDEAGHNGDIEMKVKCLEKIDKLIVGYILNSMDKKDFKILITPDHFTPVIKRTHTDEIVPFLIYGKGIEKGNFSCYSEREVTKTNLYFEKGPDLLRYFLSHQ